MRYKYFILFSLMILQVSCMQSFVHKDAKDLFSHYFEQVKNADSDEILCGVGLIGLAGLVVQNRSSIKSVLSQANVYHILCAVGAVGLAGLTFKEYQLVKQLEEELEELRLSYEELETFRSSVVRDTKTNTVHVPIVFEQEKCPCYVKNEKGIFCLEFFTKEQVNQKKEKGIYCMEVGYDEFKGKFYVPKIKNNGTLYSPRKGSVRHNPKYSRIGYCPISVRGAVESLGYALLHLRENKEGLREEVYR